MRTTRDTENELSGLVIELRHMASRLSRIEFKYHAVIPDVVAGVPADRALDVMLDLGSNHGELRAAASMLRRVEEIVSTVSRTRLVAGEDA